VELQTRMLARKQSDSAQVVGVHFEKTGGWKITLPDTNLNDVSDQADDLIVVYLAK
jgi:hypothetical protein